MKFDFMKQFLPEHITIQDPENEYANLAKQLGCESIAININSTSHVNPLDLNNIPTAADIIKKRITSSYPHGVIIGDDKMRKKEIVTAEIEEILKTRNDNIILIDTEDRYTDLVDKFDGQLIKYKYESFINPFEVCRYGDDYTFNTYDVIRMICRYVKNTDLTPLECSIIDYCVKRVYETIDNPTFVDFYKELEQNPATLPTGEKGNETLITVLKNYVNNPMIPFIGQTTISHNNRFIVYDLSSFPNELIPLMSVVILQHVYERYIKSKRTPGVYNWIYGNDMESLFLNSETSYVTTRIIKTMRKFGGVFTGVVSMNCIHNSEARHWFMCMNNYYHITNIPHEELDFFEKILGIDVTKHEEVVQIGKEIFRMRG